MKIILILLDGLGDRSYKVLDGLTPLQAASTLNLNRLAYLGSNGLFHPLSPGQCLPSETAHYLLFGYDLINFPGRGLLEAVGECVKFDEVSAAAGCMGLLRRKELMLMMLNYSDRSALLGHRLGKTERPYFPNDYEPFKLKE
ncbi:MAG: hypothetical protein HQ552_00720 [Desulfobacteraceae bacterium]|nr:hypothetical protein [Desulfobacteraceae bacterium]